MLVCNKYGFAGIGALMASVSLVIGLLVLNLHDLPQARAEYYSKYKQTTFTIANVTTGSYRCCEQRGCTCIAAPVGTATCSSMILGLVAGTCTNGPQCCRTAWDTCYTTCYNTCYNTCYRTCYDTCRDSNGRSYDCRPYNCRPYDCRPYDCRPYTCSYQCNEHCVESVTANTCQSYCSNCFRPSYSYVYSLPVEDRSLRLPNATISVKISGQCGIDQTDCATAFIGWRRNGDMVNGYYNIDDYQDIIVGNPNFEMPKKIRDGIISVSVFLGLIGLAGLVLIVVWICTAETTNCPCRCRCRCPQITIVQSAPPPPVVQPLPTPVSDFVDPKTVVRGTSV